LWCVGGLLYVYWECVVGLVRLAVLAGHDYVEVNDARYALMDFIHRARELATLFR